MNPEICAMLTFPKGSSKALGRNLFGLASSKALRVAIIPNWWGGRALKPVHVTCKAIFTRACDISQFCPIGRPRFVFSDLVMLVIVETMAGNTITMTLSPPIVHSR